MRRIKNHRGALILMIVILTFISIVSMTFGDVDITVGRTFNIILDKILSFFTGEVKRSGAEEMIILNIRIPRILAAVFVGMGLSSVGCAYQGIFKNPMADPYILGISSGATLGAAIMIILNKQMSYFGIGMVTLGAFIGAALTTLTVYLLAMKDKKISTTSILLSGIAISYLISAVISMILVFSEKNVSKIIYWTMGSLTGISYRQILFLIPAVLIGSMLLYSYARELDVLTTGEEMAESLGIDTARVKTRILIISSFVVAVCVSFTGVIGFVGLMMPHIVRMVLGPRHKKLIPFAMVSGAIFLVIADTIARSLIDSAELPIGAVTALFGAPYFIYLLLKRKRGI